MSSEQSTAIFRHEWPLSICIVAPLQTSGQQPLEHGIDKVLLRECENPQGGEVKRYILSGYQLLGNFRHFLFAVRKAEDMKRLADKDRLVDDAAHNSWFRRQRKQYFSGDSAATSADGETSRGLLQFRDLPIDKMPGDTGERTRIRINDERASAENGQWVVLEKPFATGAELTFRSDKGRPTVILYGSALDAKVFEAAFSLFVKALNAIAGNKSQGFGKVKSCSLGERNSTPVAIPKIGNALLEAGKVTRYRVVLGDALLVDPVLHAGNLQIGSTSISGAVFKAAIAETGRMPMTDFDDQFGAVLSSLTLRRAVAVPRGGETLDGYLAAQPLSLCIVQHDDGGDVSHDAFEAVESGALKIQRDFKPAQQGWIESKYFPAHCVKRDFRTRTAIEPGTSHAAESQLFNYQAVSPFSTDWILEVAVPAEISQADLAKANRLIEFLGSGVVQIGKLKAQVSKLTVPGKGVYVPTVEISQVRGAPAYRIKLDADAFLIPYSSLDGLRAEGRLAEHYRALFRGLLGAAAQAVAWEEFTFIASHQWAGGSRSVRCPQLSDGGYHPYLMTLAGSVFVLPILENADPAAIESLTKTLQGLVLTGLPAPRGFEDWARFPFVPGNGFGQISITDRDRRIAARRERIGDA